MCVYIIHVLSPVSICTCGIRCRQFFFQMICRLYKKEMWFDEDTANFLVNVMHAI